MYFFCDSQATEESNLELGWRFHQSAWGKGYATEAARAIAAALRDQGRCESFAAIAEPENEASINIMKKLGMSFQKQAVHRDQSWESEAVYYGCPATDLVSNQKA